MIEKLVTVTLFVADQDKALDFYTKKLGFQKRADNTYPGLPRYVNVGLGGQEIGIVLWKGKPVSPIDVAPGGTRGAWVLETNDCRKDFERLKSLGVQFEESEPIEAYGAVYATIVDPDGNRLLLREQRSQRGAR